MFENGCVQFPGRSAGAALMAIAALAALAVVAQVSAVEPLCAGAGQWG